MIADVLPEIQRSVESKLARFGGVGSVVIDGTGQNISLVHNGSTVTLPIGALSVRWTEIAFEERERECTHLARSLTQGRRPAPPPRAPSRSLPIFPLAIGAGLLLAAAAGYSQLRGLLSANETVGHEASAEPVDPDAERQTHASQVCNATRARLARGGTVGPTDTEGWVVELSLLRSGGDAAWPPLDTFVAQTEGAAKGRILWTGTPELARLDGHDTRVERKDTNLPETTPQFRRRTLTFYGNYVLPYFRERDQIQVVRLAHALAESQGANLAGLYARCSDGEEHHMGAWFVGSSPGAAAASLLFHMGAHAEPAQLPREVLSSRAEVELEPEFALTNLIGTTQRLKKQDLSAYVGPQDGTVAGSASFTTIAFPFVESDRALVSSRSLARLFEPDPTPVKPGARRRLAR